MLSFPVEHSALMSVEFVQVGYYIAAMESGLLLSVTSSKHSRLAFQGHWVSLGFFLWMLDGWAQQVLGRNLLADSFPGEAWRGPDTPDAVASGPIHATDTAWQARVLMMGDKRTPRDVLRFTGARLAARSRPFQWKNARVTV